MTELNKKENIAEELSRAQRALAEANLLFENGYLHGAVSRLYHYLLYVVRALLLSRGLEPKSHEGALRLFAREFVKKGIFAPDSSPGKRRTTIPLIRLSPKTTCACGRGLRRWLAR